LNPNGPAEKVSILETAICKEHTTFYDKKNNLWRTQLAEKK